MIFKLTDKKIIIMATVAAVIAAAIFISPEAVFAASADAAVNVGIGKIGALLKLIIRFFGGGIILFGLLNLGTQQGSHDGGALVRGIISIVIGVVVVFAPEIVNWISPEKIF